MFISVSVVPRSSKNEIRQLVDGSLKIKLTVAPVEGKANEALIELLSEYFGVAKSRVRIVKGEKGRKKIIEISKAQFLMSNKMAKSRFRNLVLGI